ncbi:MAG: alpha/beta fold hydrolase, partial [Streptosporangiaceae bacterium]
PTPSTSPVSEQSPPTGFEDAMCTAFAQTLGLERVGPDDNFFALGGHSLLAMRLAERLRAIGMRVDVRTIIEAPTVSGLIERLDMAAVQDALGIVLPIRPYSEKSRRSGRPPVFCVHPVGGLSWCYLPLARYVPDEYPLYGLQAEGLDGAAELPCSVRDMAARYIDSIKAVQQSGPYHLLGWSFGGIVAHEIAAQLQATGEQVASLIIMDAYPPRDQQPDTQAQSSDEPDLADVMETMRAEQGRGLTAISEHELAILARVYRNNMQILRAHQFARFEGDMLVVSATEGKQDAVSTTRWQPFVSGEIAEFALPCEHSQMSRPDLLARAWDGIASWRQVRTIGG